MSGQTKGTRELSSSEVEESSTLDHALLESLFYNEMMMLNGSSPTSNSFFSQHFNEATHPKQSHQLSQLPLHAGDPTTIAESEMLRDFGVSSAASHPSSTSAPLSGIHDHHHQPPTTTSTIPTVDIHGTASPQSWNAADSTANAHTISQQHAEYSTTHVPVYSTSVALHPVKTSSDNAHLINHSLPVDHQVSAAAAQGALSAVPTTAAIASSRAPAVATAPPAKPSLTVDVSPAVPHERAKQLVSQFATLASRLGIELPTSVLQSLTTAAAQNDSSTENAAPSDTTSIKGGLVQIPASESTASEPSLTANQASNLPMAPTIAELRKTAAEAIATVKKRRFSDTKTMGPGINDTANDSTTTGASAMNSGKEAIKHSKRRKKPRLADCASRLAELKAENELLKRHLQNVSNKAHRFDQEREEAGKRIHGLLGEKAGSGEMDAAVNSFTDLYSDYGKNRQQELSFHLQQLQRLVNPTSFTKMGLWTMGQNSISPKRNPIAGILQNELEITAAQGRKILEQSEKIRALCENLKECLVLLAKLKSLCEQKTQIFHDRMNKCREILTSKQVVKLIKWINDHTHLLESVCPGWGTEHIHSSVSKSK